MLRESHNLWEFQQDNTLAHKTAIITRFLNENNILILPYRTYLGSLKKKSKNLFRGTPNIKTTCPVHHQKLGGVAPEPGGSSSSVMRDVFEYVLPPTGVKRVSGLQTECETNRIQACNLLRCQIRRQK